MQPPRFVDQSCQPAWGFLLGRILRTFRAGAHRDQLGVSIGSRQAQATQIVNGGISRKTPGRPLAAFPFGHNSSTVPLCPRYPTYNVRLGRSMRSPVLLRPSALRTRIYSSARQTLGSTQRELRSPPLSTVTRARSVAVSVSRVHASWRERTQTFKRSRGKERRRSSRSPASATE